MNIESICNGRYIYSSSKGTCKVFRNRYIRNIRVKHKLVSGRLHRNYCLPFIHSIYIFYFDITCTSVLFVAYFVINVYTVCIKYILLPSTTVHIIFALTKSEQKCLLKEVGQSANARAFQRTINVV